MPVNWNDKDVLERLFIATLASFDNKVNINEIARLYGEDMTYDALENRLRKWKEATALKDEAAGRESPAKSPVKTRAKKGDAGLAKGAVKAGRITKKKAPAAAKIKSEPLIEEDVLDDVGEEAEEEAEEGAEEEFM